MLPEQGTFYAGVKSTIAISGGLAPYVLTSSDPGILPVPDVFDGHFLDVVPANPGVVDPGLTAGEVPRRTVTLTARDSKGITVTSKIAVLQNFLTGYVLSFIPTTCPAATPVCAGGETIVRLAAITNGSLHGNEAFRFDMIRGGCKFVATDGVTLTDFILVQSDHSGVVQALMRCSANVAPGIGLIRVTHVASGVTVDTAFVISSTGANASSLLADPSSITFTGPNKDVCGTGSADISVFGGKAPFTATSSFPNSVGVTPSSSTNPGRFTVTAFNPGTCVSAVVIIQDATGAHVDVTVKTEKGTGDAPAPPAFDVQPTAITLACATTGSVTAVGGSGSYVATSSHPRVVTQVSGNTISITRCGTGSNPACAPPGDGALVFPTSGTVSVSDGTAIKNVTVTVPANCP
jgi:hypothetical protein